MGPILLDLNNASTVHVPVAEVAPAGLRTDPAALVQTEVYEGTRYKVWQKTDDVGAPPGKYLAADDGRVSFLVDPGINGRYTKRADGSEVRKFDAPKATLMSYIINGILDRELPWALVLFGVMIALVLEMSGIPSLAFAVGVYLPLSSSTPIFIGGMVRWVVDRRRARLLAAQGVKLNEEQLAADSDKSPGVLMASGYIAGGAIAGIVIAFLAGVTEKVDARLGKWAAENNPFFAGPHADALSMIPFVIIVALLYLVGREALLKSGGTTGR
jgi:OPT oligopeptide transporter protein